MLLTPVYDGPPPISVDGARGDVLEPFVRQRTRLGELLAGLDEAQWATPSRCDGWSVQDVVAHLVIVNGFWDLSIKAGLAGEPTRYLSAFDPAVSPAEAAPSMRVLSAADTLEQLVTSNQAIFDLVRALDGDGWQTTAEAPAGHLPIRLVVNHALWDGWVHERDIVLPLGLAPVEEPDEVRACLRFAAALGPALGLSRSMGRTGAFVVDCADVGPPFVVEVSDTVRVHQRDAPAGVARLSGGGAAMTEALSIRGPRVLENLPESDRWMLSGLADTFDATS
jgi:uncharacterized protein (TIGR03083 family)